jgi:hypothetical protein
MMKGHTLALYSYKKKSGFLAWYDQQIKRYCRRWTGALSCMTVSFCLTLDGAYEPGLTISFVYSPCQF